MIEWRVTIRYRPGDEPIPIRAPDPEWARQYAALEREEYPHAIIAIESREVSEWEPIEDGAA